MTLTRPAIAFSEMDEREIIAFLNALYEAWDEAGVDWGELFTVTPDAPA